MIRLRTINYQPIGRLGIHKRITNHLLYEGITTIGELTLMTAEELLAIRGLGKGSLREIRNALAQHGLRLRGD